MQETDLIGAPFSKQRLSMTLYDAAKSNEHGVFYEAADPEINLVRPCVMPSALSMRSAYDGDTAVAQSVVKLWEKVHCSLTSGKRNAMEGWEMVVPLLEVIASLTVQRHHLVEWAEKAHARAKHLGLKNESYYVGLYVSNKGCRKLEIVHP